ncbi:hypothetical protein L6164_005033 [Bauhinia variegata]|uniref:Uncharacterized protein n=1 Tax=Bauhinia variegata TaxID=167791 RepID=A0ACB9PPU2_BAUVA|nr:hypothetical protein L6164_005033 [Bauhinia variegata]
MPIFLFFYALWKIQGVIFCPLICLITTIGNSAIIVGLWPVHFIWTYYCVLRAKRLGPILKLVTCVVLPVVLILWPVVGIVGSVVGGAAYGFFAPMLATFDAIGEGKTNEFLHTIYVGTSSTVKGSFTVVTDLKDVCFTTYFLLMDDLREKRPPDVNYYEIRLLYLPGAVIAGVLGVMIDAPMISIVALYKGPCMLFKGWHRLFHDLIGREGPFLETICVPFAGLAILLWPLAVVGAVLASVLASIFLGAYAGVVAYQESSLLSGLKYIVAAISIYDEYSNDILDLREGSCYPRPRYRKKGSQTSRPPSLTKRNSFHRAPSRTTSFKNIIAELKPLELLDGLFQECRQVGEMLVSQGLITLKDIEDAKSGSGSRVISIGLPAYCLLQCLLRSAKNNSPGISIADNIELVPTTRPTDKFFEWFLNPLIVLKEQIKAENLSASEEDYLCKLALLNSDPERLKNPSIGPPPESERKRGELEGITRRLQGITKSMSRYPTFKRRFDYLVKALSEDLAEKHGPPQTIPRSKSAFARIISLKSFKAKTSNGSDQDSERVVRDVEIS